MKPESFDLLVRTLDGDVGEDEARRLRVEIDGSTELLAAEIDLLRIRAALARGRDDSFAYGFEDRVVRRVFAPAEKPRFFVFTRGLRVALSLCLILVVAGYLFAGLMPTRVVVAAGETRHLRLPDGSQVQLSSGSELSYRRLFFSASREVRVSGEAFFDVTHSRNLFHVNTFNAEVVVHGTRFGVRAWPRDPDRQTAVTLEEGKVELRTHTAGAKPVFLKPGQTVTVTGTAALQIRREPVQVRHALSWRSGGMYFMDRSLPAVLDEVARRYDVRIDGLDPGLASLRVSYLNPDPASAEAVISDICHTLGLRYRKAGDGFMISAPGQR